jgi:glycosyltransferase involved in cell wall biosynthesis
VHQPDVTIVCATRNGCDAVRLTLSSLRQFTPEPHHILVADNGSTDGTREYLQSLNWIELFRRDPRRHASGHGATLDWLMRKVTTRYALTLDSDVVFLRSGWLSDLRTLLESRAAAAVGELESGVGGYRSRLAPYVLLFDTEQVRALRTSFKPCVLINDPAEVDRWRRRGPSENLSYAELRGYRSAAFYSTGAMLFERMVESGVRWAATPLRTRRKYRHLGHMSWGPSEGHRRADHRAKLAYVQALLQQYATGQRRDPI